MTGHATHFLERTKRLDESQVNLAIRLYKYPQLLRIILREINPPKEFDRVAIELEGENDGPYLVATRKGQFVTCLGKGMRPTDLYVISKERFNVYHERINTLAQRREYWAEVSENMAEDESLDSLIVTRGLDLNREQFLAASVFQPAFKHLYIERILDFTELLRDTRNTLVLLKKKRKEPPDKEELYRLYWNTFFALGHMTMMASMFGPQGIESWVNWTQSGVYPFYPAFHSGQIVNACRALFAAGRMGRHALQVCEVGLKKYHSSPLWIFSALAAAIIGHRHKSLRSRVKRILKIDTGLFEFADTYLQKNWRLALGAACQLMEAPDEAAEAGRQMARTIYMEQSKARNYPPPWRFENETDIPEDLALSHMVNMVADFRTSPQHLIILVSAMEWLSRTDAENLFAPKDLLGHMNHQWHPNHTQYLLDNDDKWYGKRKGDRKLFELPGRNHPCICGSNKKFKKCCMSRYPKTVTSKLFFNEAPLDHLCCPAMDYGGDSTVCKT